MDSLRLATTEDSRNARCYAYNRWPEDFCSEAGLGYAPKDSNAFRDFCQQKGLKEELLFELGMLKRKEDGTSYSMFRERIMIPIRNRWGRIIAYTARYIGANPNPPSTSIPPPACSTPREKPCLASTAPFD